METAPLKSFAIWARTALIREVNARIVAVLAPASKDRVESASAVAALERDIAAAGGDETGRTAVVDKVAYTWFNRIIALRFMDANGYTGIGIVSPIRGQTTGQTEVLADAKRGNIDPAVVTNKRTIETITALLDGTRRSDDPQGEVYALLLAEYCRHWNRSMPFMFEREGDYTELLIPANLLADDSVLARATKVLTEDVCQDVEVIGWLYQFYISERKDEVFAGFKKNKKAGAAEIPAATQLFTPHWIVRYLVENSLGRLWLLNRPTSRLAEQMEYYIAPVDEETDFLKISSPEELRIIDPAVGSGHMLTYAFDLLFAIYEEEGYAPAEIPGQILQRNLFGTEIDPRAGALAAFALAMKARAKQRAFFSKGVQPNICVLAPISFRPDELDLLATPGRRGASSRAYRDHDRRDIDTFWDAFEHADTFGSLICPRRDLVAPLKRHLDEHPAEDGDLFAARVHVKAQRVIEQAEYLSQRYSVVIANPPYMGGANMNARLSEFARSYYLNSKSDLFAMFIQRALGLVLSSGCVGMITMQSWMFLTSFEALRREILRESSVITLAHLGTGAFDSIGGAVVSTAAFVLEPGAEPNRPGKYIDLTTGRSETAKARDLRRAVLEPARLFVVRPEEFLIVPGAPLAYALTERHLFARPRVGDVFSSGGRLKTHANATYVRYHWEVSAEESRWRPFHNGGARSAFYGNDEEVVDWSPAAVDAYGRHGGLPKSNVFEQVGVTWSMVGSAESSFRIRESGELFSSGSPTIVAAERPVALAYGAALNTPTMARLLRAINPTINNYVADVLSLPQLGTGTLDSLARVGAEGLRVARGSSTLTETSRLFDGIPCPMCDTRLVAHTAEQIEQIANQRSQVVDLLNEAEGLVTRDFGTEAATVTAQVGEQSRTPIQLVQDLVSYAVGCMLGRYSLDEPGLILTDQGGTLQEYLAKVPSPSFMPDKDNVIPIVDGDWFEDDIVARFRKFLRVAFGEQHFEENLHFVTESLGVKDLRDYFGKSFYKDHVQRYKKRPIYWLFSSPKGSFNALIYMHRYTQSTVSTVLNEYLREFKAKLEASRQHHVRLAASDGMPREKAAAAKEVDRLRKVLLELDEYEHDVLYPLATQQITIDLDDGVKANYPKFGTALKKIAGLEASDD